MSQNINPFSYWVKKDLFAAGEYPGSQYSWNYKTNLATLIHSVNALKLTKGKFLNTSEIKIRSLLDAGIVSFVDLTERGERPLYNGLLHSQRRKKMLATEYNRFPIKDKEIPQKKEMVDILDFIDLQIYNKKKVYVHCFRGLGRTGTVLGCYLIRHGATGKEALATIKQLRNQLAGSFRDSPETLKQKSFILDWKE
jgi:protein-tyrosine phosphatase